jgi:ribosomal protein S18 acetylase RimI-like enzyme
MPAISLRPARAEDSPFLYELFKSVRAPQFAVLALPAEQLESLMRMQYQARTGTYRAHYPDSDNAVVLSGDRPIGQLWVFRSSEEHRIVDIALLPDVRGQGIGGSLLAQVIAEASASGVPLRCSVATNNEGSLRLHQRLGFRITGQDEAYYRLEYHNQIPEPTPREA